MYANPVDKARDLGLKNCFLGRKKHALMEQLSDMCGIRKEAKNNYPFLGSLADKGRVIMGRMAIQKQ